MLHWLDVDILTRCGFLFLCTPAPLLRICVLVISSIFLHLLVIRRLEDLCYAEQQPDVVNTPPDDRRNWWRTVAPWFVFNTYTLVETHQGASEEIFQGL